MSQGQLPSTPDILEGDYEWGISHGPTEDELDEHLRSLATRKGLKDSTIATKRSRLAKYARLYEHLHGDANLLDPTAGADPSQTDTLESIAYGRAVAVFEVLHNELETDRSKLMYYSDINQFYERLSRWGKIQQNPVDQVPEEFGWEREESDNAPLTSRIVGELYDTAILPEEELIVLGLAAWGLRPNEVASLHRGQIRNLEESEAENDGYPYIEFDEKRKNGPGTVSILFGAETLRDRFRSLESGYVFPSTQSETGHVTTDTIRNRFYRLAEEAEVTIRGETPTPKAGRRFWYTTYQDVMGQVYEQLDTVAEEQGSASADVVEENYLSEAGRRRMRRSLMQDALSDAFASV